MKKTKKPFDLEDWVHRIKNYEKGKQLLKVCEWRDYPEESVAIFCALIPDNEVEEVLKSPGWDFRPGSGLPGCYIRHHAAGRGRHEYGYSRGPNVYEPLIHHRTWHGVRDSCVEVSEEFRLYHELYHVRGENRYIKIDDDGLEEDAIFYTTLADDGYLAVEISKKLLYEFCLVKKMHLAIYFDIKRKRPEFLKDLDIEPDSRKEIRDELLCLSQVFQDRWDSKGSWSGLCGKRLFLGTSRENRAPWGEDEDDEADFEEFIVGFDDDGNEMKARCGPTDKLRKDKEIGYYTLTYFRRDVLSKYYSHPEKYQIEDGFLRCHGLWGLNIDNDHEEYVSAFLGDIGMMSQREQSYWKSFNFWPAKRGLSETAYRRGILGEFAPARSPDFVFKQRFTAFQKEYQEKYGSLLFKELEEEDQHNLTALRVPHNDGQAEFDAQVLSLSKILVDSLSDEEIERRLKDSGINTEGESFSGEGRTIQKLERLLGGLGAEDPREGLKSLRTIQGLRSASTAHRKGKNYKKWAEELKLKEIGTRRAFSELLVEAYDLLDYLAGFLVLEW